MPNMERLTSFAEEKMGWGGERVRELLGPIVKRKGEKDIQTHISSFMVKLSKDPQGGTRIILFI